MPLHLIRRVPVQVVIATLTLGLTSCARPRPVIDPSPVRNPTIHVELANGGRVVEIALERYVAGTIVAEADFRGLNQDDALRVAEVQAILARTYALSNRGRHADEGFDLCATTHCQVYRPSEVAGPPVATLVRENRYGSSLVVPARDAPRALGQGGL